MLEGIVLLLRAAVLYMGHKYDPHQVHLRELKEVRHLKGELKSEAEVAIASRDILALSRILKKHKNLRNST